MRALLVACWFVAVAPAFSADPPEKKDDPPHAVLKYPEDQRKCPNAWEVTLEMTTASGTTYELSLLLDRSKRSHNSAPVQIAAVQANWLVEHDSTNSTVTIYGVRTKEGQADAVKSVVLTNRLVKGNGQLPHLEAVGGVKVETREADPKAKPDPAKKPRPAGPDLGAETYVEFDFSTVPQGVKDVYWNFTMKVHVEGRKEVYKEAFETISDFTKDAGLCRLLTERFNESSYKAELVGKTTIRVYGQSVKDRYFPAVRGEITSPDLKPEELPKVTNPKRL